MALSLRDSLFCIDGPGKRSLKGAASQPAWPAVHKKGDPVSVRKLCQRFSGPGTALRALDQAKPNAWTHVKRAKVVEEVRVRVRNPGVMAQKTTGLCGPISILVELARRSPTRYVLTAKQLLETGKFTTPTGRVITAEAELRAEPIIVSGMAHVDWMLAATMRDDENVWEDVDDDAYGLESMTFWGEMRDWTRDVLDLPFGGWETCFVEGEIDCMKKAQNAVAAGGVAFFLVDANLIKNGGSDDEEDMHWRKAKHSSTEAPGPLGSKIHSKDDAFPPDHWVVYLGGFNLGNDPDDDDPVKPRLWSWAAEYHLDGNVDAFTEYLYAVVTGRP